ncbi:hypothetical protein FSB08_05085 [Paraburkholderia sp. JPY432]|uniref:hypothetical protein n=1 Tax=Paraburkholderia youngii TaxID=2782701 RepID=UPI001595C232|nr:hypothetical protein [Paraburkholderia youngii]NVH71948.1 hypothetical protein [Paraburkholderia youngii]
MIQVKRRREPCVTLDADRSPDAFSFASDSRERVKTLPGKRATTRACDMLKEAAMHRTRIDFDAPRPEVSR